MDNITKIIYPTIYAFLIFLASFFAPKEQAIVVPQQVLVASSSAIIDMPQKIAASSAQDGLPRNDNVPWGTTEKISDHLYRTYVGSDGKMGTSEEILTALNVYRKTHNVNQLSSDTSLCVLAKKRAQDQSLLGKLDSHKGLEEYMNDSKHWEELNVTSIGENASYGYTLTGTHLIEWVFDADSEHRDNQLSPSWTHACAGVSNVTVDIVFGKR